MSKFWLFYFLLADDLTTVNINGVPHNVSNLLTEMLSAFSFIFTAYRTHIFLTNLMFFQIQEYFILKHIEIISSQNTYYFFMICFY